MGIQAREDRPPTEEGSEMTRTPWDHVVADLRKEVRRLRKIEHAAWHVCESSEERVKEKLILVGSDEFHELSKLLPMEHPPHYE